MNVPRQVVVTLLSRPDCHLCEEARAVIEQVRSSVRQHNIELSIHEKNILHSPQLVQVHAEEIPVVLVNGRRHSFWRVHADRLTAAVIKAAGSRRWRGVCWR